MELILKALLAYLAGSVVGSLLIGRLRGGVDIRTMGSGNAGGTNALRTQGPWFALGVMIIDVGKGWLATGWLPDFALPGVAPTGAALREWVAPVCAFAVILGHVAPLWHGFRGGKGVATLVGAIAGLDVWLLAPLFATWLAVVLVSGFVGLASMAAALALPLYILMRDSGSSVPLLLFLSLIAVFVIFTHRKNIARMREGVEPRAKKLWLVGRGRS